jgi:hypothetical protein
MNSLWQPLGEVIAATACLAVPLACIAALIGLINLTLGPLLRSGSASVQPQNFLLSDLLWLLIQLQLVMGLVVVGTPRELTVNVRVGGMLLLGLAVLIFWAASLQAVSRAGIRRLLRRAVVFLVLMPGTLLAILGLPLVLMAFFSDRELYGGAPLGRSALASALLVALACSMFALRWLAAWCVASKSP